MLSPAGTGTALLAAALLAGCGGPGRPDAATTAASPPPSLSPSSSAPASPSASHYICPVSDGGSCRGPLRAGTYTTTDFDPKITYTVPDGGWANWEDVPGNFNLTPPGQSQEGINAGTSDYVGIYAVVAAPNGCNPGVAPGVGTDERSLARWVSRNPALRVRKHAPAQVGGLSGDVFEVAMAPTWKKACPYSNGTPVAPILTGRSRSSLDHNISAGMVTRLYLLKNGDETLAVECTDVHGGKNLALNDEVLRSLRFG